MENKAFGNQGEKLALNYLSEQGYQIKATNWYYKHKEIDIIAEKDSMLCIIEVKTRSNDFNEVPNELVPRKKQRFLIDAAEAFINQHDFDLETRFDVVFIFYQNGKPNIQHITDAFEPHLL